MDLVPDIDELLDQLEASESKCEVVMNERKATQKPLSSKTVPSSSFGTCANITVSKDQAFGYAEEDLTIGFVSNSASPPVPPAETSILKNTADVTSKTEDSSFNLIDLDPVDSSNTSIYNDSSSNSYVTADDGTFSVLEEIFSSVSDSSFKHDVNHTTDEKSASQLTSVPRVASCNETALCKSNSTQHYDTEQFDNVGTFSTPTESDFVEMEAYLASCEDPNHILAEDAEFVASVENLEEEEKEEEEEEEEEKGSSRPKTRIHCIRRFSDKARNMIRRFSDGSSEKLNRNKNSPDDKLLIDERLTNEMNEAFSDASDVEEKPITCGEREVVNDSLPSSCIISTQCQGKESGSLSIGSDCPNLKRNSASCLDGRTRRVETTVMKSDPCNSKVVPSYNSCTTLLNEVQDSHSVAEQQSHDLSAQKVEISSERVEYLTVEDCMNATEAKERHTNTSTKNLSELSNALEQLHDSSDDKGWSATSEERPKKLASQTQSQELIARKESDVSNENVKTKVLVNEENVILLSDVRNQIVDCDGEKNVHDRQGNVNEEGGETKSMEGNSDEEAEELGEDSIIQDNSDVSVEVTETSPEGVSVIASTHDISAASTNIRLTESELQLGKVKPEWIADTEMTTCMLCCTKFTFLLRRHHCRSCGRLLCAQCTSHRAVLPYMNDSSKKFKVCEPCFQTLERIEKYEEERSKEKSSNEGMTDEASTSAVTNDPAPRATKSVLKIKNTNSDEDHDLLSSSEGTRRCVKFRDGVTPGSVAAEATSSSTGDVPPYSSKPKKIRTSVSKRLKELRMEEENVCFLPDDYSGCMHYRTANGAIDKYESTKAVSDLFTSGEAVVIAITRNLWCKIKLCALPCCRLEKVVCVTSCGMATVGLDEILIAYDMYETDDFSIPFGIVRRVYEIYKDALKQPESSPYGKIGIREAHLRVPAFYPSDQNAKEEFMFRDLLLFRPSVECFENLLVPQSPFLVGCFLHHSESIWAMAIPQRLLYRIGLQASYYPTPIVNIRSRDAVYSNIAHTTVLKVFCDFKNWAYRMPTLYGSTVSLCDNETRLSIPNFAKEELVSYNKNMIAWALDFNGKADSHLVCEQDENALYKTRVFTSGNCVRKITGASFIVIDGALKGTDVPVSVNVVEDGITIRLRPDTMTKVTDALSAGTDCKVESPLTTFSIEWKDITSSGYIGELVSPIDNMPLMGKYQYGLSEERILSSLYIIPGISDWALRLVAVYNCDDGRFPTCLRSKVFAVAEQIAAQIPHTITPFVNALTKKSLLELCIRIHVTPEEAEYKAAPWEGLEAEYATWTELLDNQLVPGLFNVCSYITIGFTAEISFALISTCSLP